MTNLVDPLPGDVAGKESFQKHFQDTGHYCVQHLLEDWTATSGNLGGIFLWKKY